jgi:hypothetical protein
MARGLIWLPLLGLFFWLAWAGWNEYQKVEAYRSWAMAFDRAKYDIYAVLGQKGTQLTWGRPTRKGMINLESFGLETVQAMRLLVNDRPVDAANLPAKGRAVLEFVRLGNAPIQVPFTEPALAAKWEQHLQQELQQLQASSQ